MAQSKSRPEREVTRKETVRRRRDQELNRRVVLSLLGVGALLVLLIGAGIIQELVIKPNQPVVTVDGTKIGLREYQQRVKFDWFLSGQQVTDPQGTSLQTLDELVDDQLLLEQAKQRGITVTQDEIDQTIEKSFGYYRVPPTPVPTATPAPTATPNPNATPSKEPTATPAPTSTPAPTPTPVTLQAYQKEYQAYLAQIKQASGMSEADFRKIVEIDLIRQKLYDEVTKDVPTHVEQVRARHILIAIRTPEPTPTPSPTGQPTPTPTPTGEPTPTPTPAPRDDAQALALATQIKQQLDAGADFATLAKEYSDDTGSKDQGGELGWFPRDSGFVKEFEDAAFSLQPGQISDPVKTQFGYHIIQVEERDPAHELDAYTIQQRKYDAYNTWLTDLRNAAKIDKQWSLDKVPPTPNVSTTGG